MEFRIGQVRAGAPAARSAARRRPGGRFATWLAPDMQAVAATAPAMLPMGVPVFDSPSDAAAQQRAAKALDGLADLQLAWLDGREATAGELPPEPWPEAADPGLRAILEQIRVREAVERARRERDRSGG